MTLWSCPLLPEPPKIIDARITAVIRSRMMAYLLIERWIVRLLTTYLSCSYRFTGAPQTLVAQAGAICGAFVVIGPRIKIARLTVRKNKRIIEISFGYWPGFVFALAI